MPENNTTTPILAISDQTREALDVKANAIRALCHDIVSYWLDIGRYLAEILVMLEAEEVSFDAYQAWVQLELRLGKTTERNLRRTTKYLEKHPAKLDPVPKPNLLEAGWHKLQLVLFMDENKENGKKTFLDEVRYTEDGVFLRFTQLTTEFELVTLTTKELERLRDGKPPYGKSPEPEKSPSSDPKSKPADEARQKLEAECEALRARVEELEAGLEQKNSELEERNMLIQELRMQVRMGSVDSPEPRPDDDVEGGAEDVESPGYDAGDPDEDDFGEYAASFAELEEADGSCFSGEFENLYDGGEGDSNE
jgi:hypothetical protein